MAGTAGALGLAAAGLALAGLAVRQLGLPEGGEGLVPSDHMPGHEALGEPPAPEAGPVLVEVE